MGALLKNARSLEKSILIHGYESSHFFKCTKKLLEKEKVPFFFADAESSITTDGLFEFFGKKPKNKLSDMSYREKVLAANDNGTPATVIFFCTKFLDFLSVEQLSSKSFLSSQFDNVGSALDLLSGHLPSLRDAGGRVIFVGVHTAKYGSPLMASFQASQESLKSVIASLDQDLRKYGYPDDPIEIVHVETTRPDLDFFQLFEDTFEPRKIRKDDGNAYYFETNRLLDLIES